MSIITEFYSKIKQFINANLVELGVSVIIILVGISCFFLGKMSVNAPKAQGEGIKIMQNNKEVSLDKVPNTEVDKALNQTGNALNTGNSEQVVASKNGKRYYYPWCGAAERISAKNKIYFANAAEAMKAGLTKAANCKGM